MGFISFLKSLFSKKVESNNEKPVVNKVESKITDSVTTKPVAEKVEEKTTAKEIKAAVKKVETTEEVLPSKPKRKYKPRKKKVENNAEVKPVVSGEDKPKARKPRRRPAKKNTEE